PAPGLAGSAVATALAGFLVSVQFRPAAAVPVAAALAVPVGLLAVAHRLTRPWRPAGVLAVVTALLAGTAWTGADRLYERYYGPTHPVSATPPAPVDRVLWLWAGALTPTSFTVTARLVAGVRAARLVVRAETGPDTARYGGTGAVRDDTGRTVRLTVTGLRPGTRYAYGLEVDGRPDPARGRLATPPAGPASFRFAVGSCARTGSTGRVFDAIRATDPLFYLNTGDFFYGDVDTDDLPRFRRLYDRTLTSPAQAALYRSTATAYVWDDHDYGPDNADAGSPSRPAAARAYREAVPHHPLAEAGPDGPIAQAFTVGRVRFLLTDTRSARSGAGVPAERRTVLGERQRAWLEAELRAGRDRYALVVWVNPDPWIDAPGAGADTWGGFAAERRRLADVIARAGVRNLLMVSGDAHMLAIDDGRHSDYSGTGGAGFPVFHAAPLDRTGRVKGGPYSSGTRAEGGQFGLVSVQDPGRGPVTVTLSGRTYAGEEVMRHRFRSPRP
ncbi:MAG: hypothetical protein AVDCRST_MAG41-2285, partial [uncultured Corynebacteriales bacterium]